MDSGHGETRRGRGAIKGTSVRCPRMAWQYHGYKVLRCLLSFILQLFFTAEIAEQCACLIVIGGSLGLSYSCVFAPFLLASLTEVSQPQMARIDTNAEGLNHRDTEVTEKRTCDDQECLISRSCDRNFCLCDLCVSVVLPFFRVFRVFRGSGRDRPVLNQWLMFV